MIAGAKELKQDAFFAYHENILLAMLADDDKAISCLGTNNILRLRKNMWNAISMNLIDKKNTSNGIKTTTQISISVQKFQVSKINENAKTKYKLIYLTLSNIHKPPTIGNLAEIDSKKLDLHYSN